MAERLGWIGRPTGRGDRGLDAGLYARLLTARVRSDWQYRTSFATLLVAQAAVTALEAIAIVFILRLVPDLGGWGLDEVVFLYALSAVPFGLADLIVSAVERVAVHVQMGTFDRILLRPASALLQISALEFELRRAGKLVPAVVAMIWAVPRVDIDWTAGRVAVLVAALLCGTVIYGSLWVMTASLSFWAVASKEATNAVTYGGQFANEYPLHLYRPWIRATLGWAVPLAFVSYVPSQHLLDAANPLGLRSWLVYTTPVVAGLCDGRCGRGVAQRNPPLPEHRGADAQHGSDLARRDLAGRLAAWRSQAVRRPDPGRAAPPSSTRDRCRRRRVRSTSRPVRWSATSARTVPGSRPRSR